MGKAKKKERRKMFHKLFGYKEVADQAMETALDKQDDVIQISKDQESKDGVTEGNIIGGVVERWNGKSWEKSTHRYTQPYYQTWKQPKVTASPFSPHSFTREILVYDVPEIQVSRQAFNDMLILVDEADGEIGWLGTVKKEGNVYTIEEVFLLKQNASSATTQITVDGLAEYSQELLTQPDGMDKLSRTQFWGHSHVNMGTSPSGQDESQMSLFKENGNEFYIRGILNKKGRMEFAFFDWKRNIRINDVPWKLVEAVDNSRREMLKKQIEDKVAPEHGYYYGGYNRNTGSFIGMQPNSVINTDTRFVRREDDFLYSGD